MRLQPPRSPDAHWKRRYRYGWLHPLAVATTSIPGRALEGLEALRHVGVCHCCNHFNPRTRIGSSETWGVSSPLAHDVFLYSLRTSSFNLSHVSVSMLMNYPFTLPIGIRLSCTLYTGNPQVSIIVSVPSAVRQQPVSVHPSFPAFFLRRT